MISVKIEELTKIYKRLFGKALKAVDHLTLSIEEGEIFGFLGPNGAGKTTTLKMLTGLLYPTSGKAWILEKEIKEIEPKKKIGFLPEHPSFYQHLSARELLHFYGAIFGIENGKRKKKIESLFALVGLEDVADQRIHSYSKGMIQRIGIAQSLINDPELVILDEPLSGLDPIGRKDVKDILLSLREEGKTVFFSTHILPDVEKICDRVGILIDGKLVKVGSLNELLKEEIKTIDITLSEIDEQILSEVRSLSAECIVKDRKVFLTIDSTKKVEQIQRVICRSNCRIISIIPQLKTLEEYFSHLVTHKDNKNRK
ncbi:MAG: ABC transporter ATP-binding protein [Candidatus Cloacimonadota bacterium]|nr:MAG: ABC transporter ATP-binding protein [Candidatus Cloacimonadota bacterium]